MANRRKNDEEVKHKRTLKVKEPKKLKVKFVLSSSQSQIKIQDTTKSAAGLKKKCNGGKDIKKGKHDFPKSKSSSVANSDKAKSSSVANSEKGGYVESSSTSKQIDSIENQAAKLKLENKRMHSELRQYADMCMELNDENKRIMDELKLVCEPYMIQMLEAQNPNNNSQTNQQMEELPQNPNNNSQTNQQMEELPKTVL